MFKKILDPLKNLLRKDKDAASAQAVADGASKKPSSVVRHTKVVDNIADPALKARNLKKLLSLKDRYLGGRCFIIGNGPSLNKIDMNLLKEEITFGVNGIFYKYDESGFKPTFYAVEDNHVVADNLERIKGIDYATKFFPARYLDVLPDDGHSIFLITDMGFYWNTHQYYCKPRFSKECDKVIYCGQTVTYLNLQLAYYMGFKEVYLIGMDFSYAVPPKDEMQVNTIVSGGDDPNHFHPEYFGKGKKWHDPKLDNCKMVYEYARKVYEEDGRKIYNATVGGRLEVFERVEFTGLFPVKR